MLRLFNFHSFNHYRGHFSIQCFRCDDDVGVGGGVEEDEAADRVGEELEREA